jgi:hypothetical protein
MQQSELVSCDTHENVNLEEFSNEELVAQCRTLSLKAQEADMAKAGTVDVGVFLAAQLQFTRHFCWNLNIITRFLE